jgi:PIN domain nuclease of toxin-antitoxin system
MNLLLDTHILLWWFEGDTRLSANDRAAIAEPDNEIFVSAASAYEVAIKAARRKIDWDVDALRVAIGIENFRTLDIRWTHLATAGAFPIRTNKDPWDRILVAQSILEQMPLLTSDARLTLLYDEARAQLGVA